MRVYVGQARGHKLIKELTELGFGEVTQRNEFPPRRIPWFLDNGAFKDWKAGEAFDAWQFVAAVQSAIRSDVLPDFIVVPDIVAGGKESRDFSLSWGRTLYGFSPLYVAIQDGMDDADLTTFANCFWVGGFFVGGSLPWKMANGKRVVDFARSVGRPCHIGRVGTQKRVRWAMQLGADSIDSSLPLWSTGNLDKFVRELQHPHLDMGANKRKFWGIGE